MKYPNQLQVALLFDRRVSSLEKAVRFFLHLEEARDGHRYNVPEAKPNVFYRLFGADELMITFEYVDRPIAAEAFAKTLASPITRQMSPDVDQLLKKHRTHVLINISHGVLGGVEENPGIAAMLAQLGMRPGASLPQFKRRLEKLALLTRIMNDTEAAELIHWVQSNQLYTAKTFEALASVEAPGPLHVHPYIFGGTAAQGQAHMGFMTFGARHFIGHELIVEPNALPWHVNYETALTLLRIATVENGYIIPHGETFGPEGREWSYRADHRPAEQGGVPVIELVPLTYPEHGFHAEGYVRFNRVIDPRRPPMDVMPPEQDEKQDLVSDWQEKRQKAARAGIRYEVRAPGAEQPAAPPTPPRPVFRRLFGRRGLGG